MKDRIIQDQIRRDRETFVRYLKEDKGQFICALASSYHDGTPCNIFAIAHGSFNVCVSVQFDNPQTPISPDRWVVRIPFPGRVPWIDEKIDSEVATMKYITDKTTIPIPKIHAWSYEAQSPIGHAFIIMDHVQGTSLNALSFRREARWASDLTHRSPDLTRVYDQLADIYIQLRGLEFSEVGSLGMPTSDSPVIAIRHRPLPVEVALQEVERLNPTTIFPKGKTFTTDREYIRALVDLGHNRLARTQDPDLDSLEVASEVVLAHDEFYKHMLTTWLRRTRAESKPFVLMHGDLNLHGNNLLWDEKLNLVAVLDWEWCYAVPVSCFIPPTWLIGFSSKPVYELCNSRLHYSKEVEYFRESIARRSRQYWPQSPLEAEWKNRREPHCALVLALLYPETVYDIYWEFLIYDFYSPPYCYEIAQKRFAAFLDRPGINNFLSRRVADQKRYDEKYELYVREHGKPQDCRCLGCEQRRQSFEILQELPRL